MNSFRKIFSEHLVLLALVLISLPARLYHYTYPIADSFYFRQTQTATFALNFYKQGINLFQTELDMFGIEKERFLVLEFPVYEALVASLYKLFFFNEIWGRVVSIAAGYAGAYFLFRITLLLIKRQDLAFFSAFFFLFAPLNIFYHRSFMIDPTIIAFLLAGFYFSLRWIIHPHIKTLVVAIILLSFGFIQKGLYGPFWLLPITSLYLQKYSIKNALRPSFLALIIIPAGVLLLWQQYMNSTNISHGQLFFTTIDSGHLEWNFGLLRDRLSLPMWTMRIHQLLNGIFLKPGVLLFIIGLFAYRKLDKTYTFYIFLLSQVIYFIVLFRIQAQNYYQLVMIPAFSVFLGVGFSRVREILRNIIWRTYPKRNTIRVLSAIIISLFLSFYIWKSWQNTLPSFFINWDWLASIQNVEKILPGKSVGVFVTPGYDWNSAYSYYLKRKLLAVSIEDVSPERVRQWESTGYSFIILYDFDSYPRFLESVDRMVDYTFIERFPMLIMEKGIKVYQL